MARELQRRLNIATRTLVVDVEDDFGHVSHHTIPLIADHCSLCGQSKPGTQGTPDIEASVKAVIAHVQSASDDMLAKLEKVADSSAQIKEHVERAKARRNAG